MRNRSARADREVSRQSQRTATGVSSPYKLLYFRITFQPVLLQVAQLRVPSGGFRLTMLPISGSLMFCSRQKDPRGAESCVARLAAPPFSSGATITSSRNSDGFCAGLAGVEKMV